MAVEFKPCNVEECNANAHHTAQGRRGYCMCHYRRLLKHGDTQYRSRAAHGEPEQWLLDHKDYDGGGCLIWPFSTRKDGYAHLRFNGTKMYAARAMCFIVHGEPPEFGMHGAHSCGKGTDGCVHPKHVYWATPAENIADKLSHGTSNRGRGRVLTESVVKEARSLHSSGMRSCDIARKLQVPYKALRCMFDGNSWAWVK